MHPGTKSAIADDLRRFVTTDGRDTPDGYGRIGLRPSRGMPALLEACAHYIEACDAPEDKYDHAAVLRRLPEILTEAFRNFRIRPQWRALRDAYRAEVGYDIPDLVDCHVGGLHRMLVVRDVARVVALVLGEDWLRESLEAHFDAQMRVIDQAWDRFRHLAYRPLMTRIKAESHRGNAGRFGTTDLLTFACAGRVMLTFARDNGATMTYVADDGDSVGYRAGPNAPEPPYNVCVSLIEDVTNHWDIEKLKRSDSVSFG